MWAITVQTKFIQALWTTSRSKEMIRKIDPEAFVVVTETLEVMGKCIANQSQFYAAFCSNW